jgi:hypothetical protein
MVENQYGLKAHAFSADFFFNTPEGYKFDAKKLRQAHDWCFGLFMVAAANGKTPIVVDNTNITVAEIAPYYRIGQFYGYDVEIVRCLAPFNNCLDRQTHGVPLETMRKMETEMRYQIYPIWWNIKEVIC